MYDQKNSLKDRIVTNRIIKANIRKKKNDSETFNSLQKFNNPKKIKIYLDNKEQTKKYNDEKMVLLRANFLDDKIEYNQNQFNNTKKDQPLDFSMFDDLLKEFDSNMTIEVINNKHYSFRSLQESLNYLKKEIRYYENKIEVDYKLENVEVEEAELFDLKKKVDELKGKIVVLKGNLLDNIDDYQFATEDNNMIDIFNYCKMEIKKIEKILNRENKEIKITDINNKIEQNIKMQKEFTKEMDQQIQNIDNEVKGKLHLLMLKRMIYNLFKMTVGVYMAQVSKNKNMKLMVGSFLIINSTIGLKEALSLKTEKLKYYKYRDYTNSILTKKENLILACDILNKALQNIDALEKEFKNNFCDYKPWIHDYEEIYFKLDKLKEIINFKQRQISNLTLNSTKTNELKQYA